MSYTVNLDGSHTPIPKYELVFGYKHVSGIPPCPCADPGNYMMLEQDPTDRLSIRFRCWCGATKAGRFDDEAERTEFLTANGVTP